MDVLLYGYGTLSLLASVVITVALVVAGATVPAISRSSRAQS